MYLLLVMRKLIFSSFLTNLLDYPLIANGVTKSAKKELG